MKKFNVIIFADSEQDGEGMKEHLLAWYAPAIEAKKIEIEVEVYENEE